jgi:uncharacterized membrane protein
MPEATRSRRRRAKDPSDNGDNVQEQDDDAVAEDTGDAEQDVDDQPQDADDQEQETDGDGGIAQTLVQELKDAVREAALDVLKPAARDATSSAAKMAVTKGPELVAKNVMPAVAEHGGAGGIAKEAISKGGEALSNAGGIGGVAGKVMSKLGGGKGGKKASATGFGQGRRIMVQQVQYIPVNVKDVFRAWTESEWPEYMHRVNTLDRQIEEDSARYSIGVKGFWFKKNFTAEIQEQVPFKFIVWNTTQGNIKNTGRVSFHGEGDDLTLMILNLDMAPSGLREKWVRGFRYHKRGIRSDFHRFAAWVQMRTPDQLLDMEGWLGTIEGGKITQTHEEYLEEHEEERNRGSERDEGEDQEESEEPEAAGEDDGEEGPEDEDEPEAYEDEDEPEAYEDEDEPEAYEDEDEPEDAGEDEEDAEEAPAPRRRRSRQRRSKPAARR